MFYKTILRRNTKNGPKLKVAKARSKKLSLGQFSPRTPSPCCSVDCEPLPVHIPLTNSRVWNRIDFQSDKIFKTQPQSTNKEQQITATANSIYCNEKQIFQQQQRTKEEKQGWNWFQGRFSASNFPGQGFRWRTPDSKQDPVTEAKEPVGVGQCELVRVASSIGSDATLVFKGVGRLRSDRGKFVRRFLYILIFQCKDKIINS